jgi:hypothetical protein
MARSTAVPRTMKMLREEGYFPAIVEHFNGFSGHREDLYGFIDVVAISPNLTLAIQICGMDFASHVTKLTVERKLAVVKWLECPTRRCLLIGWRKLMKRNKDGGKSKQKVYKPRMMEFFLGGNGELKYEEVKDAESINGSLFRDVQTRIRNTNTEREQ